MDKTQSKNIFCEICKKDASNFCYKCMNYFCDSCYKYIHDLKDNKEHKKEIIDYFVPIYSKC